MIMGESRHGDGPVVLLVTALAAAVGLGAHGTPVWTLLRPGYADLGEVLTAVAIACVAGGAMAMATIVGYHRLVRARETAPAPFRATMARAAPVGLATVAALALAMIARTELGPSPTATPRAGHVVEESGRTALPLTIDWWGSDVRAGEGERESATLQSEPDPDTGTPFLVLFGVAVLTVLGAAVAWRGFASARAAGPDDTADPAEEHREAMHGALIRTIDAMLRDADPKRAIRGAYAKLLEGLAASGASRFGYEGPVEHLQRVLTVLDVRPEPLRELIGLFAVARFSTHPLTSAHRERALVALRAVAAELEAGLTIGVDS